MPKCDPAVTIILPTYNRRRSLERALLSILQQTYSPTFAMVCDNCSADGTEVFMREIATTFKERIIYYRHTSNVGMVNNFNFAISRCETPFLGFLSDDDYFLPTFIEEAMKAFRLHPDVQLSAVSIPMVDSNGTILGDQLRHWPRDGAYRAGEHLDVAANHWPIVTGCIYRSSLREELMFDRNIENMADIPVILRLLARHPFHISKQPGGYFIRHGSAVGITNDPTSRYMTLLKITESLSADPSISVDARTIVTAQLRRQLSRLLVRAILSSFINDNGEGLASLEGTINGWRALPYRRLYGICSFLLKHRGIARPLQRLLAATYSRRRLSLS